MRDEWMDHEECRVSSEVNESSELRQSAVTCLAPCDLPDSPHSRGSTPISWIMQDLGGVFLTAPPT